jgi:putative nucleotidyltransferase with HDIG domain
MTRAQRELMMTLTDVVASAKRAEKTGNWNEALALYQQAAGQAAEINDMERLAELMRWIGRVHRLRGDLELASSAYKRSLAIAEENGLTYHVASALNVMAMVEQLKGNVDAAEELYMRGHALAIESGDERLTAMIEQNFATMANIRGETEVALKSYAAALERYIRLEDDQSCAHALNNMGMAHTDRGEWAQATEYFRQALDRATRVGDAEILGTIHLNTAELYLKSGDLDQAREHCAAAFAVFSRLQSKTSIAETYKLYAAIYRAAGKPQLAEAHLSVVVELARTCEDRLLEAEIEYDRAQLHVSEGRNREALMSLNQAHSIFLAFKARNEVLDIDKRLDRIEDTFLQVVRAWGESIESKDQYTAGHCGRVADYALRLAEAVGITGRDLVWMRMGAFLHDVGKTSVPIEILNKPGKLTDEEFEQMKRHTVIGDAIISETPFPWDIRPIVRNHHERWNGTGYPDKLAGEDIPLNARILCVADVYDALTTNRSYRGAMSHEQAIEIMRKESGTTFEPRLFELFEKVMAEAIAQPQIA